MKCPNCQVTLVMADRNGIEIDYCPECRGVWLDRGELDKIIERSAEPARNAPQEPYRERPSYPPGKEYHHGKEYHYKKKKSILGELFDF